ncbi:tRNA uridine-5-carboxymethylaminomethyl(34) synthesis GTPase MnmE [Yoonia vestfoldensis]|uniref:tRNA uridine-5-carboxymethylaminomethyl(34) synthesis GTPase MnmE n=1 Tax=Yoonia vestfoldensis TaxID=245188 RepID=UPI00036A5FF5|nr:tRNA uridine-5-carboxymethylaminomethyl(34) synthesis GTPase MnmE [Yoonia vestfoldensis]
MDTIFALATARGRAGVAVVRISGVAAVAAAARLMGHVPAARGLRALRDCTGNLIDEALVLRFDAGKSFTGEDVVELHLHGSPAVVAAVLRILGDDPVLRPAEAGEFTRRALANGRLDLAQVEGLADLIDAETESQRRQAVRVFSGALGAIADNWRKKLIRAAALLEATIDFVDEDVPVDVVPEVRDLLMDVRAEMAREAAGVRMAERLRDGFEVAIIGAPNVGKSTLLNRLAQRDVAITSDIAGTTRDVIEVRLDFDGIPVTLLDTAGLRETDDLVESLGVARARARAEQADLRIHMLLDTNIPPHDLEAGEIYVKAKGDVGNSGDLAVSGLTGAGVDDLIALIAAELTKRVASVGLAMRERHRLALLRAVSSLDAAGAGLDLDHGMLDLIAEDLRTALRAVDSLVGRVDVEHVLDEIFSSFCIGK